MAISVDEAAQTRALEELDRLVTEYDQLGKLWLSLMAGMMLDQKLKAEGRSQDFIDSDDLRRKMGLE